MSIMKKITTVLVLFTISMLTVSAQSQSRKSVAIFGDSYSTFEGFITPSTNETWYFLGRHQIDNDVVAVEQTWWHQLIRRNGWKLAVNNSYSGSTISSSGYNGEDYTSRSFVTRAPNLGDPDIIFVFGATNDSWVPSPIGEYKYSGWTKDDLKSFRPSLARLLDYMTKRYLGVDIYFILNSELSEAIDSSVLDICNHYSVPVIELHDIDKKAGHPSIAGMKAISDQVHAFVKNHKKANKTKAASRKKDHRNSLPKKANPKRNNKNKAKKVEKQK